MQHQDLKKMLNLNVIWNSAVTLVQMPFFFFDKNVELNANDEHSEL